MGTIPKKITPSPIIEAIVEVRFDSDIPSDAIFGLLYEKLKTDYPQLEKLPILQLPEALRDADPNLKHHPHYKMKSDEYMVQIGPRILSMSNIVTDKKPYVGWTAFKKELQKLIKEAEKIALFKTIKRLGMRYINFFEGEDVYDKTNIAVTLNGEQVKSLQSMYVADIETSPYISKLQVGVNADINHNGVNKKGSLLDIDVRLESFDKDSVSKLEKLLESIHDSEKKLFFDLLDKDYLKTLNPVY